MPKALERKLRKEASEKGLTKKRADAYVYGTLRKTGWTPNKSSTPQKHNAARLRSMYKGGKK